MHRHRLKRNNNQPSKLIRIDLLYRRVLPLVQWIQSFPGTCITRINAVTLKNDHAALSRHSSLDSMYESLYFVGFLFNPIWVALKLKSILYFLLVGQNYVSFASSNPIVSSRHLASIPWTNLYISFLPYMGCTWRYLSFSVSTSELRQLYSEQSHINPWDFRLKGLPRGTFPE